MVNKIESAALNSEIQIVAFMVGGEVFGVFINSVKEIIKPTKIMPVPKAPVFIEGVINLRGEVIPVVDLRNRFEFKKKGDIYSERIIIVSFERKKMGLYVDKVLEVFVQKTPNLLKIPSTLKSEETVYINALFTYKGELGILLKLEDLLTSKEKLALNKIKIGAYNDKKN